MKGSGRMTSIDDALITEAPNYIIRNFKPSRDKDFIEKSLKSMPREYFLFAEATPDGINFTNDYSKPTIKVSIEPVRLIWPSRHFAQFGSADIAWILAHTSAYFGEEKWLKERLKGRLDGSVVLFAANGLTDQKVMPGTTFYRLSTAIKA